MADELQIEVMEGEKPFRLDACAALIAQIGSRSQLQKLIKSGDVRVNGEVVPGRTKLRDKDCVAWTVVQEAPITLEPEDIPLHIVYQDDDVVVVNKEAGMVVHPGAGNHTGTMVNALLYHLPQLRGVGTGERPGLVHRLDKDTSGLIVVAKNKDALRILQEGFADRSVKRRYMAVCQGRRMEGQVTFDTPYGRSKRDRKKFTARSGSRRAVTHVEVLARAESSSVVAASLETGRTHQIRVHLSESGHPIVGDPIYGRTIQVRSSMGFARKEAEILAGAPRLMLHAGMLGFTHPRSGEELQFLSRPPSDLAGLVGRLLGKEEWDAVWDLFGT